MIFEYSAFNFYIRGKYEWDSQIWEVVESRPILWYMSHEIITGRLV